jgi:hypothetical protein
MVLKINFVTGWLRQMVKNVRINKKVKENSILKNLLF